MVFCPAGNAEPPTLAQPTLPVTWHMLSDDNLSPISAEELLPILRQSYPDIPVSVLRHSWLNGAPFLGAPADHWPLGTYHFPGLGDAPPMSVLPTASLVTAPFLTSTNTYGWTPVTTMSQLPPSSTQTSQLTLPAAAAGVPALISDQDRQVLVPISFADFDLAPDNAGLLMLPPNNPTLPSNLPDDNPSRFINRVIGMSEATPLNTSPAIITPVTTSVATPMITPIISTLSTTSSQEASSFPGDTHSSRSTPRPAQQVAPCVVAPRPRSGKRSGSGKHEGTRSKRKPTTDTRHVSYRSSSSTTYMRQSDSRPSESDPLLSTTSHRSSQPSTTPGSARRPPGPATQVISSESSDEESVN